MSTTGLVNPPAKLPEMDIARIRRHPYGLAVWLAFVLLAIGYSLATPPFEAGDESRHYAVVKYMADTGRLPVQEPGEPQIHWSHEGNQPPLYYALAALLTFWLDTGGWDDVFWYNPHTTIGDPLRPDNKNITIHPPGQTPPAHRAVYLIRLLSIAMASVTVATVYAIGLSLFEGRQALAAGAMAVAAFTPMFIFISASVNNDNAVIMFVTLALWRMSLIGRRPLAGQNLWREAALLGLLIGLGALSKLYALGLLPLVGLFFLWRSLSHAGDWPARLSRAIGWTAVTTLIVGLVAGWFYLRNAWLYEGDFLALQVMRETAGQRTEPPSLATLRAEFQGFRIAYWGLFGGVNILADDWIYGLLDAVSAVAAGGLLIYLGRAAWRRRFAGVHGPTFGLLLGWLGIMIAGFIVWNLTQPAGQGRLFYPAIAAIAGLGVWGLTWWLPGVWRGRLVAGLAGGLLVFALSAPWLYIAPAYARPALLTRAEVPADIQPVDYVYDDTLRLIGYRLPQTTVRPAESLPLSLYWEVIAPPRLDYSIFVHVLGRERQVIGQVDTYPGGGMWPTTLLQPGDVVADFYRVPITPRAEFEHAPARLLIAAGIYNLHEPGRPGKPAVNAAGERVEPLIAAAKLVPWQWPEVSPAEPVINFADRASLIQHVLSREALTLTWQVEQSFEADYTVFIQAWRVESPLEAGSITRVGEYVSGFDGPPVQGYYPTSLWAAGETVVDSHPLALDTLPPGQYYLLVGLYHPATTERLPASGPGGPLPDYAVPLGPLDVP